MLCWSEDCESELCILAQNLLNRLLKPIRRWSATVSLFILFLFVVIVLYTVRSKVLYFSSIFFFLTKTCLVTFNGDVFKYLNQKLATHFIPAVVCISLFYFCIAFVLVIKCLKQRSQCSHKQCFCWASPLCYTNAWDRDKYILQSCASEMQRCQHKMLANVWRILTDSNCCPIKITWGKLQIIYV